MVRIGDVPYPIDPLLHRADAPVPFDLQAPRRYDRADALQSAAEPRLAPPQNDYVVHVAEIPAGVEALLHLVVQVGQVEIREILRRVVAYGQAVAGVFVDDDLAELEDVLVLDPGTELVHHDGFVDGWEELPDVQLEIVARLRILEIALQGLQALMRTAPGQCGIGLRDQIAHNRLVQDLDQRPVDDAVREVRQIRHQAGLALLVYLEHPVIGRSVLFLDQEALGLQDVRLRVGVHCPYVGAVRLAPAGVAVRLRDVLLADQLRPEIPLPLRHCRRLRASDVLSPRGY